MTLWRRFQDLRLGFVSVDVHRQCVIRIHTNQSIAKDQLAMSLDSYLYDRLKLLNTCQRKETMH